MKVKNALTLLLLIAPFSLFAETTTAISGTERYTYLSIILLLILLFGIYFWYRQKKENQTYFFNQVVNHSNSLVLAADQSGKITYVSENVRNILGFEPKELLENGWWEKTIDLETNVQNEKEKLVHKLLNEEITTRLVKCKDGSYKWIQWHDKKFNDDLIVGIGQDVTEVKQLELKEKERQQLLLKRQAVLHEIALIQSNELNLNETLQLILQKVKTVLTGDIFSFLTYTEHGLKVVSILSSKQNPFHVNDFLVEHTYPNYFNALHSGEMLIVDDVHVHPLTAEFNTGYFEKMNIVSLVDIPVFIQGKLAYVFSCEKTVEKHKWNTDDLAFIKSVSDSLLVYIENEKLKQTEKARLENEKMLKQINETIDSVFWLYDLIEDKILYISPSCKTVFNRNQDEFYQSNNLWKEYIHPEDVAIVKQKHALLETENFYEVEYRILVDGQIRWVYERSFAIRNEAGVVIKNSGICTDITREKHFQEELKKLSLIAEKTTNAIAMTDKEGIVFWVNNAFLELFEIPLDKIIGKKSRDLFIKDAHTFQQIVEQNGKNFRMEMEINTFKNTTLWIEVSNTVVEDEHGEVLHQIDIISDITKQVFARQQIERQALVLETYNKELEYQNQLKEKLLEADSSETLSKNTLLFIRNQFETAIHISLILPDYYEQLLSGFSLLEDGSFIEEDFYVNELNSYAQCKTGEIFIVEDLDEVTEKSASDTFYYDKGIRSYIVLPLLFDEQFLGIFIVGFSSKLNLSFVEINQLKDAANIIAITLNQLKLKEAIEHKNEDILSSIMYARNIQQAMLTDVRNFSQHLRDVVLFYRPKDIVSGDFYWSKETDTHSYLALGDCTGHGVPGAFLTVLGINFLEQLISIEKATDPSMILTEVDKRLFTILNQSSQNGNLKDGIELGLCVYDKINQKMLYAGATLGVLYFKDGKDVHIRGQRVMIGEKKPTDFQFENAEIAIDQHTYFYMASDGYQDQLGGERYKRYSAQRLIQLLSEIKDYDSATQEQKLQESIDSYMNGGEQLDDFTVLGFKVKTN